MHTALVTGANRGIGREIARQLAITGLKVLVGTRDLAKGEESIRALVRDELPIEAVQLDVSNTAHLADRVAEIERRHGAIDVLVNNAAIMIDQPGGFAAKLSEMTGETLAKTLETNVIGAALITGAVLPGMVKRGYGRIVNVSSRAGQLTDMSSGFPAYRMSKAALNALTRIAAAEAGRGNVKVNACSPGWVRTDMGGENAARSVAEGADTPVWLATLGPKGPTGKFFEDRREIDW